MACTYCGHTNDFDAPNCGGCSAPLDEARDTMRRYHDERVQREAAAKAAEAPYRPEPIRQANEQDFSDLADQAKEMIPNVEHMGTAVNEAKGMLPRVLGIFGVSVVLGLLAGAALGRWGIFVILIGAILGAALLKLNSLKIFGRLASMAPRLLGALMGAATSGVAWFVAALIAKMFRAV